MPANGTGARILVVEDEPVINQARRSLTGCGDPDTTSYRPGTDQVR
jgi:hypothetical protein